MFDMTDRELISWTELMEDIPAIFLAQLLMRDQLQPEAAEAARQIVAIEVESIIGHITSIDALYKIIGDDK